MDGSKMAILKLTYSNISQIRSYFLSMENIPNLTFGQRRGLARFNESIGKEFEAFIEEIKKIAEEYCEKDENGDLITMENGAQKIKDDFIETVDRLLIDLYKTETEIDYMPFKLPEESFDYLQCDKETFKLIEENFIL